MIVLNAKAETSKGSTLDLSSEKPTTSFLELLKGVSLDAKIEDDIIKFIPLEEKPSLKVIKNDKLPIQTLNLELNPAITKNITPQELKTLVIDAKKYLKTKILQSSDFKINDAKQLPKTLKGLLAVANKLGIDVKKITIDEIKEPNAKNIKAHDAKAEVKQIEVKPNDAKQEAKPEIKPHDAKLEVKQETKPEIKPHDAKLEVKQETKPEIKQVEIKSNDAKLEVKQETKPEIKPHDVKLEVKQEAKPDIKQADIKPHDAKLEVKQEAKPDIKQVEIKPHDTKLEVKQESIKDSKTSVSLFKEAIKIPQTVLTQQIVDVKQSITSKDNQLSIKTPRQKADETLKLLLRGEKPQLTTNTNLTADFSVASAKVIAPVLTQDISKSLESLLQNKVVVSSKDGDDIGADVDAMKTHKSDSFEVKVNEAKQMIKYLSTDVKQAIDDYKSPFTRIKVQLNPQQLGEVELTVVQRGKNLHINLSSNNIAVNALATNINELKTQLNNSGINNATFNFNSSSENGNSSNEQQQSRQKEQQDANEEYNYFENQEQHEEILSSLEIVVPSYA